MKKKKKKCRSHHKLKKVHVRTGFAIILASNLMLNPVFPREFHKQKVVVLGW